LLKEFIEENYEQIQSDGLVYGTDYFIRKESSIELEDAITLFISNKHDYLLYTLQILIGSASPMMLHRINDSFPEANNIRRLLFYFKEYKPCSINEVEFQIEHLSKLAEYENLASAIYEDYDEYKEWPSVKQIEEQLSVDKVFLEIVNRTNRLM
jgi:hypothetical protein